MTTRESVLSALFTSLGLISGPVVLRDSVLPEKIPAEGLIILRDGSPGEPEFTLSPLRYHYEHRAEIEIIVQAASEYTTPLDTQAAIARAANARAATLDTIAAAIGVRIAANRTLGGLCDWTEAEAPSPIDLPFEGAATLRAALIGVTLIYSTADPLG